MDKDKLGKLQVFVKEANKALKKQIGDGDDDSALIIGDEVQKVKGMSTGILPLDLAMGIGGIPEGRITEIYGNESSGKTTVMLEIIAAQQRAGKTCAFIDVEHALDPVYAKAIGVDLDSLVFAQVDVIEDVMAIVDYLASSKLIDLIVVDSVAAMATKAEMEGAIGEQQGVGTGQALIMSRSLRRIKGTLAANKVAVLFTNQTRTNIGGYGAASITPGGKALKFYASIRAELGSGDGSDRTAGGNIKVRCTIKKNKVAPPYSQAEFQIDFGKGVNKGECLLSLLEKQNLISRSGSFFTVGDEKFNGREATSAYLAQWVGKETDLLNKLGGANAKSGKTAV